MDTLTWLSSVQLEQLPDRERTVRCDDREASPAVRPVRPEPVVTPIPAGRTHLAGERACRSSTGGTSSRGSSESATTSSWDLKRDTVLLSLLGLACWLIGAALIALLLTVDLWWKD